MTTHTLIRDRSLRGASAVDSCRSDTDGIFGLEIGDCCYILNENSIIPLIGHKNIPCFSVARLAACCSFQGYRVPGFPIPKSDKT